MRRENIIRPFTTFLPKSKVLSHSFAQPHLSSTSAIPSAFFLHFSYILFLPMASTTSLTSSIDRHSPTLIASQELLLLQYLSNPYVNSIPRPASNVVVISIFSSQLPSKNHPTSLLSSPLKSNFHYHTGALATHKSHLLD